MTSPRQPDDRDGALFIADFYPRLGAWLARQHARGYDAVAGRARFILWLGTHTDASALTDHLAGAARNPRLSAGEESELLARIAAGRRARDELAEEGDALNGEARASLRRIAQDGDQARDRLLEANFWQVVSLAEENAERGTPLSELIEDGTIGLIRAIQKYDPAKGYEFATYATWWIRQAINRAVLLSPSPAPEPGAGEGGQLALTDRWLLQVLGREPTPEELAAELDLPPSATSRPSPGPSRDREDL